MKKLIINTVLCLGLSTAQAAVDTSWEVHQTAVELSQQQHLKNEVVWLQVDGQQQLALYRTSLRNPKRGAVIIIPDFGNHPDTALLISPLRKNLNLDGWDTLSINSGGFDHRNYLSDNPNVYNNLMKKLDKATEFLQARQVFNIVLAAHGHAATVAAHWLNTDNGRQAARAFVGINMAHYGGGNDYLNSQIAISRTIIPVLDVYGENTEAAISRHSDKRLHAAREASLLPDFRSVDDGTTIKVSQLAKNKTGNNNFRQKSFGDADHFFTHHQTEIVKYVRGWLRRYASGQEIPLK